MSPTIRVRILALLDGAGVSYEKLAHGHVHTSADAAAIRGTRLEEAAKALILETGSGGIVQCVVSGHRRLDLKKIKALLSEKNIALAHPDRVLERTGCPVGTVPPFGNLFTPPMRIIADHDILTRDYVVFSAGTHHDSVRMLAKDWLRASGAQVADVGKDAQERS